MSRRIGRDFEEVEVGRISRENPWEFGRGVKDSVWAVEERIRLRTVEDEEERRREDSVKR